MSVAGVSMMRNEADVVEDVVRHMATQVDRLIVADNGSSDGTREILERLACELPLTVVDDPEVAYRQSEKMTALAERAAADGAVWIVPFDADEIWYSPSGTIREVLPDVPSRVVRAELYNHLRTSLDGPESCPFEAMAWRQQEPGALPKIAFRWERGAVIEQGNHGVLLPSEAELFQDPAGGVLELRHFPVRSADHLILKARQGAAAYAAAPELDEDMGAHWRAWGRLTDDQLREVYREHWWYLSPVDAGLIHDPAPLRSVR
jgi:glycosyltransferase involved in cell wall biosynthesis